ncbi:MAG: hypothetical protein ACMUHM_07310 [Thermoplasmatota archaeon]
MGERVLGIILEDEEDEAPYQPEPEVKDITERLENRVRIVKYVVIGFSILSFITAMTTSGLIDEKLPVLWGKHGNASDWEADTLLDLFLGAPWSSEKEGIKDQIDQLEAANSALSVLMVVVVITSICQLIFVRPRFRKASVGVTLASIIVMVIVFCFIVANSALFSVDAVDVTDVMAGLIIILIFIGGSILTLILNIIFLEKLKKLEIGREVLA